jgi:hypothetical protein
VSKFIGKRRTTGMVAIMVACIAGASAYAFTASNTVPAKKAGSGAGAIAGYTVSNASYTFNADGTTITGATFNLDAAANDVKAALTGTPVVADWQDCGAAAAVTFLVTCTFATPVAVASATSLHVIAVEAGTATVA